MCGCELDHKEDWALKNWCFWTHFIKEKTLDSPLDCKEVKPVNSKGNQPWIFIGRIWSSNILATWCKEPTHWKRPWCWKILKTRGEGGNREWDGWMASQTQWTWVWANWEIMKDREVCWTVVRGVAKSWTWFSDWITTMKKAIWARWSCVRRRVYVFVCTYVKLLQLCMTRCNPMDYSLPGSTVHGIL